MAIPEVEAVFISRLKKGDPIAFSTLYDKFAPALYSSIVRLIPDLTNREELLEEIFQVIRLRINEYNPFKERLFTWAYKNHHSMHLRVARASISQRLRLDLPLPQKHTLLV